MAGRRGAQEREKRLSGPGGHAEIGTQVNTVWALLAVQNGGHSILQL